MLISLPKGLIGARRLMTNVSLALPLLSRHGFSGTDWRFPVPKYHYQVPLSGTIAKYQVPLSNAITEYQSQLQGVDAREVFHTHTKYCVHSHDIRCWYTVSLLTRPWVTACICNYRVPGHDQHPTKRFTLSLSGLLLSWRLWRWQRGSQRPMSSSPIISTPKLEPSW